MRHVHSGSAETVRVPGPPAEPMGCCGNEVVTWQLTVDGVSEPSNDWSQAIAVSVRAARATARAGMPAASNTERRAAERFIESMPGLRGSNGTVGISNSEAIATTADARRMRAAGAAVVG